MDFLFKFTTILSDFRRMKLGFFKYVADTFAIQKNVT